MSPVKAWVVTNPDGALIVEYAKTREDAIGKAFDPRFGMPVEVARELQEQHRTCAGWSRVEAWGWTVRPRKGHDNGRTVASLPAAPTGGTK